jgi:hypothetical protein
MKSLAQVEMLAPNGKIQLENIIWLNRIRTQISQLLVMPVSLLHHQAVISQNEFRREWPAGGRSEFKSWSSHLIFLMVNLVIFCLPVSRSIGLIVTEF